MNNRKVILGLALSLDAMIEGPHGEYDWCFTDQDYGMKEFLENVDSILYGRKSYELMTRDFANANPFSHLKSYIFSKTFPADSQYTVIRDNIYDEIQKLKSSPGKNLWLFGGAQLATEFFRLKLIDQLSLAVHPIILGQGKPLFTSITDRVKLKLNSSKAYSTGLVSLEYDVLY
jgi:dihydrofolate reductase